MSPTTTVAVRRHRVKPLRGRERRGPLVVTAQGQARPYRPERLPDGRPVLQKRVAPEHELTTPAGVAVDEAVLLVAEREGLAGIVVERVRTGEILWASLSRWRSGIPIRRGFGPQRALLWRELQRLDHQGPEQVPLFPQVAP